MPLGEIEPLRHMVRKSWLPGFVHCGHTMQPTNRCQTQGYGTGDRHSHCKLSFNGLLVKALSNRPLTGRPSLVIEILPRSPLSTLFTKLIHQKNKP